jgi:S-adenosylmethionine decarboxylase
LSALGKELSGRLVNIDPKILESLDKMADVAVSAAKRAKATVISVSKFKYPETYPVPGVGIVIIIAESHIILGINLKERYGELDINTCGEQIDPWEAANYITEMFGAKFEPATPQNLNYGVGVAPDDVALPHKAASIAALQEA